MYKQIWQESYAWDRQAERDGHRQSVFVASMADVLEDNDALDGERQKLWTLVETTPHLNWLLLTKRPDNVRRMAPWQGA